MGRDQSLEGLVGHDTELGFYSMCNEMPLKGFKQEKSESNL